MKHFSKITLCAILVSFSILGLRCSGGDSADGSSLDLRQRVRRVKLDNGLTVLMMKRQGAPVFSAQIKVEVGNIEEEVGSYGLAHFFEHMAFKGTDKIGTTDPVKEQAILDEIFKVGTEIVTKRKAGATDEELKDLISKRKELEDQQKQYITKNEFTEIFQKNGGLDLNASTSNDYTTYYISLPANKLELWAYMESARMQKPFLREFFTEVDVVAEERRMRIDNTPDGLLFEALMRKSFDKSPYGVVVIGPAEDIRNYTPQKAQEFYAKYYIPSKMVVGLVGNFDLDEAEKIVRKYFGQIPAGKDPGINFTKDELDPKTFPREVTVTGKDRPRFYLAYHRPAHPHPDDMVMDVIQDVMCEGLTSRLYKKLVIQDKKAAYVGCYSSMPGSRLDGLFAFYAMPFDGYTNAQIREEIKKEIDQLIQEGPTEYELQKVKNNLDADLIYSLQSNDGLASQLAFYESLTGNWEYIYELQNTVHKITAEDVKRVAKTYFNAQREITSYYEQTK